MVDPGRVLGEELGGPGPRPLGQAVVVFLRGGDLPAHDEEHDIEDGDALREGREVGEGGEDVGEDFGERVGVFAVGRVKEGEHAGVARADDFVGREAVGGALAALVEEV